MSRPWTYLRFAVTCPTCGHESIRTVAGYGTWTGHGYYGDGVQTVCAACRYPRKDEH